MNLEKSMVLDKIKQKSVGSCESNDSYLQFKKTMNEFKTFALGHIEKWDKVEAERLAKKFQLKKCKGQWLSIN